MSPLPSDVSAWRANQRQQLIAIRRGIGDAVRGEFERRIMAFLDDYFPDPAGRVFAGYWPIRGEPDLRPWMQAIHSRGAVCALPVVVVANRPLAFHHWTPDAEMTTAAMGISVPAMAVPVVPDVVIAPVIGFDSNCFRLGFGGGYYDRTFASLGKDTIKIGVGFAACQLPTIHPRPHDIAMHAIITEKGVVKALKT